MLAAFSSLLAWIRPVVLAGKPLEANAQERTASSAARAPDVLARRSSFFPPSAFCDSHRRCRPFFSSKMADTLPIYCFFLLLLFMGAIRSVFESSNKPSHCFIYLFFLFFFSNDYRLFILTYHVKRLSLTVSLSSILSILLAITVNVCGGGLSGVTTDSFFNSCCFYEASANVIRYRALL